MEKEKKELDILIDRGVKFTTTKKILRFGKKEREWVIKQPYLGTLDHISSVSINMKIDESLIQENPLLESKIIALENAKHASKVVAIAVINNYNGIKLFSGLLARYFMWRLTPSKLLQIALLIQSISNFSDFTNSIRLMTASRTTKPREDLVEQKD
jgi:hypothetical protein